VVGGDGDAVEVTDDRGDDGHAVVDERRELVANRRGDGAVDGRAVVHRDGTHDGASRVAGGAEGVGVEREGRREGVRRLDVRAGVAADGRDRAAVDQHGSRVTLVRLTQK